MGTEIPELAEKWAYVEMQKQQVWLGDIVNKTEGGETFTNKKKIQKIRKTIKCNIQGC